MYNLSYVLIPFSMLIKFILISKQLFFIMTLFLWNYISHLDMLRTLSHFPVPN